MVPRHGADVRRIEREMMRQDWHLIDPNEGWYICKRCGREYFDEHINIKNQYEQYYICPDCILEEQEDEEYGTDTDADD